MIKEYGFKLNVVQDLRAYKLGAIELPKVVLRPDGQWSGWTPIDEKQHTPLYDTYGCAIYGTENILQTLERFQFGETSEYDERYNYNIVGINPPGADPHDAAESFRNDGVVSGLLPMTETYEEYAKPRPMPTKYVAQGIAHPYELRHQWLWTRPQDKANRTKLIKEYLKYSPLGVSVTAWQEKNGVYVDGDRPNTHWVMLYGWNDKGWLVYDSYAPHRKILSFDHNIEVCKRYILIPSTRELQLSIWQKILELTLQMLGLIKGIKTVDIPTNDTKVEKQMEPKYLWDTPTLARHSVRVICDEEGLSVADKNIITAVIACESGFNTKAVNKNSDGSYDYGIIQANSYWYIEKMKLLTKDQALNDPEFCVRLMIKRFRQGFLKDWVCYSKGLFVKHL